MVSSSRPIVSHLSHLIPQRKEEREGRGKEGGKQKGSRAGFTVPPREPPTELRLTSHWQKNISKGIWEMSFYSQRQWFPAVNRGSVPKEESGLHSGVSRS